MDAKEIMGNFEYVEDMVNELLDAVEYDDRLGPIIDELVGVALPNLKAAIEEASKTRPSRR